MTITDDLKARRLYYDGASGTYLQGKGIAGGKYPELLNLRRPDVLYAMHRGYFEAGANIALAHTFGANRFKLAGTGHSVEEVVTAGVKTAKRAAAEGAHRYVSLDIGPLGRLLEPVGDLDFEEAVALFAEVVRAGVAAGCDLITAETMSDLAEIKACMLAVKENSDLPLFVTAAFQEDGRMLTGADIDAFCATVTALGADAIGFNCSFGPEQMQPLLARLLEISTIPVIANPNAGLPEVRGEKTVYNVDADAFSTYMATFARMGVAVMGGCCGTDPHYIRALVEKTRRLPLIPSAGRPRPVASSYLHAVRFDGSPRLIGERINPTGKPALKRALQSGETDRILREAIRQEEAGADLLDVNVGFAGAEEKTLLPAVVRAIQSVSDLPLSIDTADPSAMEAACRAYIGRPLLNSVSGKAASMEQILPVAKRYGGLCIALLLDDDGIPESAAGRLAVADRILAEGKKYGLTKADFLFDPLTLTVAENPDAVRVLTETLLGLEERGLYSVAGISNVSFGLPRREGLNAALLAISLSAGLSAAIVDVTAPAIRRAYQSALALLGYDRDFSHYLVAYAEGDAVDSTAPAPTYDLAYAIKKGMVDMAAQIARQEIEKRDPMSIIDEDLVPALDAMGRDFEAKTLFLPQLLRSADAAAAAFAVVKAHLPQRAEGEGRGKIILATVQGDIHDIGKNIVKALLENYNFRVIDLGKDVPPRAVLEAVRAHCAHLVGLSALMTTTVGFMEETIRLLRAEAPEVTVMVGGAVLNADYGKEIAADFYGKDAMATVRFAEAYFDHKEVSP